MTEWFIEEEGHDAYMRRETSKEDYLVQEEKIGSVEDPDYTILRVLEDNEVVAAATYHGDGSGVNNVEFDGKELIQSDFEYDSPVQLLNGVGKWGQPRDELEGRSPLGGDM